MTTAARGLVLVAALLGAGCGGTIEVACDDARCEASCVSGGDASGVCSGPGGERTGVCRPALDVPGGLSTSLATGGMVRRSGGGYQLSLTVGPVSVGSERSDGARRLEVGPRAVADPGRE